MNARICATCGAAFETDVVGETICAVCDQRTWLAEQAELEAALAERRRLSQERCDTTNDVDGEPRTACPTCGYVFFAGSHGARTCPACIAEQAFEMQQTTTIAGVWEWLMAKLGGRSTTIH